MHKRNVSGYEQLKFQTGRIFLYNKLSMTPACHLLNCLQISTSLPNVHVQDELCLQ